jgi:hypothetical protein
MVRPLPWGLFIAALHELASACRMGDKDVRALTTSQTLSRPRRCRCTQLRSSRDPLVQLVMFVGQVLELLAHELLKLLVVLIHWLNIPFSPWRLWTCYTHT